MANELMIPEASEVPAYIRDAALAKKANEDAAAGISTGYPPQVKLSGKQFTLVDSNGDDSPYPPAKLVAGPDGNVYLPSIVLRARREFRKKWYATKYNPNAKEFKAPDCFSNDAERPDGTVKTPQCDVCANCPMNAYGSGTDQDGNAAAGKACSDTKVLAIFVPNFGIYEFDIPPGSLKNWALYVKKLTAAGIPVGNVKTLIGFDLSTSKSVLVFQFGGFLDEKVLPKLAAMSQSAEAEEIISGKAVVAPAAQAAPAPAKQETTTTADDLGLGEDTKAKEDAEKKTKADAAAKKKAEAAAKKKADEAAAAAKAAQDDLGLDMGGATEEPGQTGSGEDSDAAILASLGL
jgi:hypothetical protein